MSTTMTYVTIAAEPLKAVMREIVTAAGSSPREAELVADHLVEANLTGHDSHGVGMLPRYVEVFLAGDLKVNQHVAPVTDAGALLTLDGKAGFGQVMAYEAMEQGIERAARHGVAVVGLSNSHHIGRIGHWAEQCIRAGYVSMHYVNVISEPVVAPFGGRDARFVTNPFCVGIPLPGREPVLLDFATSRIAMGKVRVAMNKGEQVKPETLLDHRGEPTTDPNELFAEPHGAILPFGEHKGFGLAVVCELLGGALTGGGTLHHKPSSRAIINNMLSIIIDPNRLGTAANLSSETAEFVKWVKESPVARGVDRIRIAGEPEQDSRRRRGAEGIPIDATTWGEILDAAAQLGLKRPDIERLAGLS
ncbi:malate/lactate/ureidoglycolate dehydrogenase [Skermanella sp. TT6]|uniref:Malate/lactate/ureidoglycolate dehydrogenase n=1 Tax=Skermanella cutis TaxID=2775420 RepID=A0ABX7B946_9PROT|nr:malate/lactate/ureidoglycolate dehydrogenase [Skermanella sp. TT6]QQP90135.1 malate/lactate/ureidoglycolate dehydrogenase [Skermanella sp. TT6]